MLAQRAALPIEMRTQQSAEITRRFLNHPIYEAASTVFCYCAMPEEIDTHAILLDALRQGKRLCVPRCGAKGVMTAHLIPSLTALTPGTYGILEPHIDCPLVPPEEISLCVVPCLCTDRAGYRLGYGGGYYDRFLAQTRAVRAALCAQQRLLAQPLPREETDLPCDLIFTERQVYTPCEK